jgi:hypothetical protein
LTPSLLATFQTQVDQLWLRHLQGWPLPVFHAQRSVAGYLLVQSFEYSCVLNRVWANKAGVVRCLQASPILVRLGSGTLCFIAVMVAPWFANLPSPCEGAWKFHFGRRCHHVNSKGLTFWGGEGSGENAGERGEEPGSQIL